MIRIAFKGNNPAVFHLGQNTAIIRTIQRTGRYNRLFHFSLSPDELTFNLMNSINGPPGKEAAWRVAWVALMKGFIVTLQSLPDLGDILRQVISDLFQLPGCWNINVNDFPNLTGPCRR